MFTDEQEEWLGQIIEQDLRRSFHVLEDPEGRLQRLGEKLVAQLPPSGAHYRFLLVDSPELNSFGTAGGRIFIFRRAVAFAKDEDQLASLLGHEIGHVAVHEVAIRVSGWFRKMGVTQVGDRQDIFNKWNQFKDTQRTLHLSDDETEGGQHIADRVGLYAMARAGYEPARAIDYFDRLFLTKGKTGGFWSALAGNSRPEYARLRDLVRNVTPLQANCVAPPPPTRDTFAQWRDAVIRARRAVAQEDVPGLISKTALQPTLRGDLDELQFSADGKYVLAQDESGIFVLSRKPLAVLFRIDAPEAKDAQFTPDSTSIVFYDRELRVQKWSLEAQEMTEAHELDAKRCWGSSLSPTGEVFACARPRLELSDPVFELQFVDVATGQPLLTREKFYELSRLEVLLLRRALRENGTPSLFGFRYSPDGRYVIVHRGTTSIAYDLRDHAEVKMPFNFKVAIASSCAFVGTGEVVGYNRSTAKMSRIEFPSGRALKEFPFAKRHLILSSTQKSGFALLRGMRESPALVLDLQKEVVVMGYKQPALAFDGAYFAGEGQAGEIIVAAVQEKGAATGPVEHAVLPDSPLGASRVANFSPDGAWLAVSESSRGAVWGLADGIRAFHTANFDGAFFDSTGQVVMKFPANGKEPPKVFQFNPSTKAVNKLYEIAPQATEDQSDPEWMSSKELRQLGDVLLDLKPVNDNAYLADYTLTVKDLLTGNLLWERRLAPDADTHSLHWSLASGPVMTLVLSDYPNVRDAVKDDPSLKAKFDSMEAKKTANLIQAIDRLTGKPLGGVLVDTGKLSFRVESAGIAGDTVVAKVSGNRTFVYSLRSGEQTGKVFGHPIAISAAAGRLLVGNQEGEADLYDLRTMKSLRHFTLPARIATARFTTDGSSLLILTAAQMIYKVKSGE
ncbi:MAG TPA: M48 family metalloprotease [Candidatus Saccharimonadales bacterium]|nr:M48 family metalloprotease [Candidatus Saccharimonadales bacterium]